MRKDLENQETLKMSVSVVLVKQRALRYNIYLPVGPSPAYLIPVPITEILGASEACILQDMNFYVLFDSR